LLLGAKYYNANNSSIQGPGSNGIDAHFEFQNDNFPDYPSQSSYTFPNKNLAVFGENIFYLNEKLSITPGFRLEYILTKADGNYNMKKKHCPDFFPCLVLGLLIKHLKVLNYIAIFRKTIDP